MRELTSSERRNNRLRENYLAQVEAQQPVKQEPEAKEQPKTVKKAGGKNEKGSGQGVD